MGKSRLSHHRLPSGTGDEPLTVAQTVTGAKAVVVTTPQEISLADVRKSINFCRQVNMEIIGVVENMSGLACPHCGKQIDLFKHGGGRDTALKMGVRFLGDLPVEPRLVEEADRGGIGVLDDTSVDYTQKLSKIIDLIVELSVHSQESKVQQNESAEMNVKGEQSMNGDLLFAIPTAQGELCSHFGHCEQFAIINVQDGKVVNQEMLTPPPHEPGLLPRWLGGKGRQHYYRGRHGKTSPGSLHRTGHQGGDRGPGGRARSIGGSIPQQQPCHRCEHLRPLKNRRCRQFVPLSSDTVEQVRMMKHHGDGA